MKPKPILLGLNELNFDYIKFYINQGLLPNFKKIFPNQYEIIEELDKQIVLLPDFDAAGIDTVNIAVKRGWSVAFPEWDDGIKDANDAAQYYGRLFTVRSVLESVETSSTKIKILAKSRCK